MLAALSNPAHAAPPSERENQVRAALLYSLAKFTDWPSVANQPDDEPFKFCVLGEGTFGDVLVRRLKEKTLKGRPLEVRQLSSPEEARRCSVLFLIPSEHTVISETLQQLTGLSVLTVGTTEDFLEQGGIVRFVRSRGKLRFEINLRAARDARLQMDARLLKLARRLLDSEGGDH